jgi:hypothetical protein
VRYDLEIVENIFVVKENVCRIKAYE